MTATQQDSVAVLLRRVLDDNHACGHTTPDTLNAIEIALQSQQVASADRGEAAPSLSAQVVERVAQLAAARSAAPSGVSDADSSGEWTRCDSCHQWVQP